MTDRLFSDFTSIYNVREFGASGAASASANRIAIQNAIDAATAAGGGTIFFPAGVYSIDASLTVAGSAPALRFLGCGGDPINMHGTVIVGNFTDYLIRASGPGFRTVCSFEYLGLKNGGTFTINNTASVGAAPKPAWSSGTTYTSTDINKQVYGSDGMYYNNMVNPNTNHDPTVPANQGVWWEVTGISRNLQVGGGCIYCDMQSVRFIGCNIGLTSGIGIYSGAYDVSIENCVMTGSFPTNTLPSNAAARRVTYGVYMGNGTVSGARCTSLGTAINLVGIGMLTKVRDQQFEICGDVIVVGTTALNWFDLNTGNYRPATNYGGAAVIDNITCESCYRGLYVIGGVNVSGFSFDSRGGLGPGQPADNAFVVSNGKLYGCSTSGAFSGPVFDLSGAGTLFMENCTATCDAGGTPVAYPSGAGGYFRIENCTASSGATPVAFDGARAFANLPSLSAAQKGWKMRCSNVSDATKAIGSVAATGTGSNNVEVSWSGTQWIVVGP